MNQKVVHLPKGSRDFLLQRQDVFECGIDLCGLPRKQIILPVPWPLLSKSIDYLFPYIRVRFKNPILMMCRAVYTFHFHHLCSKIQAGIWALNTFELRYHLLIEDDIQDYQNGTQSTFNKALLQEFEEYCAHQIDVQRTG